MLNYLAGIKLVHVPYHGQAAATQALISGDVQLAFGTVAGFAPLVDGGLINPVAIAGNKRIGQYPDIPTIAESGYPIFNIYIWYGFVAPAGTPPEIVTRLNQELRRVLANQENAADLDKKGYTVSTSSPSQLSDFIKSDVERWKELVKGRICLFSRNDCGSWIFSSQVQWLRAGAIGSADKQQRVFMDLGLKGCRALIAGASKGLGKACAKSLIGEGARVFICSRNREEIEGTAAEIKAEAYLDADVSRPEEVRRLVAKAIEVLGGLDILVTNAGGPPTGPFDKAPDKDWDIAYQLNLMSAVRLIREALPALKASGRGRIINLTGYGVKEPMTDLVVSDLVRAGVTVMAKTIASDLAPFGITVNNIAPGPIMTDRLIEILAARAKNLGIWVDEQFKRFAETIPVRRMGQPKEIGDLCAFLCSPQAGYLTGQAIVVDGGVNRSI